MDEDDTISIGAKSPIKRLGSTRKLLFFNSKFMPEELLVILDVLVRF